MVTAESLSVTTFKRTERSIRKDVKGVRCSRIVDEIDGSEIDAMQSCMTDLTVFALLASSTSKRQNRRLRPKQCYGK